MKKKISKVTKAADKPKFVAILTRRYENKMVFTGVLTFAACVAFACVYGVQQFTDMKVAEIAVQTQSLMASAPVKTLPVLGAQTQANEVASTPDQAACEKLQYRLCTEAKSSLCSDVQTVCSKLGF